MLGCGVWEAYIQDRGGSRKRYQLSGAVSLDWLVDSAATGSVQVPGGAVAPHTCNEVFSGTEPWRDELLLLRSEHEAFVGPIQTVGGNIESFNVQASDLFYWMERRFLEEDVVLTGDVAWVFEQVFNRAHDTDPTPGTTCVISDVGTETTIQIIGKEFPRAADLLRDLANQGLDFITVGRTIYAGGEDIFSLASGAGTPLILHDDGCAAVEITKNGDGLATDVSVFGEGVSRGQQGRITGRATRDIATYGLVQLSFADFALQDGIAADAEALSRLLQLQPSPIVLTVTLSPDAPFTYQQLLPGRQIDMRLTTGVSPVEVMETMRIGGIHVQADEAGNEAVTLDIIPVGQEEEGA